MRRAVRRVAYFLDLFPAVTDPFILNEMLALEAKGLELGVYAWRPCPRDRVVPPELGRLKAPITYLEPLEFTRDEKLRSLGSLLCRHPMRTIRWGLVYARRGRRDLWYFVQGACLARRLLKSHVDHIHSHFLDIACKLATTVAQCSGIPLTFTLHADEIYDPRATAELRLRSAAARAIVTISQYNRRWLGQHHGISPDKVHVVHCGIDPSFFTSSEGPAREAEPLIVCVARLHRIKGLDYLITACRMLRDWGYRFRCVVLGHGPEQAALTKQICDEGMDGVVELLGQQTQEVVRQYLRRASLFVLPSRSESWGVATMEAMACEVPVVVTRVRGVPELVEHEQCGLLVPPEDVEALAGAMARLLDDPALRQRLAVAARQRVLREFTLERQAEQLLEIWGRDGRRETGGRGTGDMRRSMSAISHQPSAISANSSLLPRPSSILCLLHLSEEAGAAKSLAEIVERMDRGRFRFTVVSSGIGRIEERLRAAGAEVVVEPSVTAKGWRRALVWPGLVRRLRQLIRQRGVDVVHVNYQSVALPGVLAARGAGVPSLVHVRTIPWLSWSERWALRQATRVLCVSETVRQAVLRSRRSDAWLRLFEDAAPRPAGLWLWLDPARCLVVSDGRDLARWQQARANGMRHGLGVDEEAYLVGIAGSLEPNKRQDLFLQVAAEVAKAEPCARFLVIGEPNLTKHRWYKEQLIALRDRLELDGRVIFAGWRQDMPELMRALDLYMLLSRREACPGVLIEAMAAGTPIVTSAASGGAAEMVGAGADGAAVVLAADDPKPYAEAVVALLRDPARRRAMAESGRRRAARYDIARAVERLAQVYETVVKGRA